MGISMGGRNRSSCCAVSSCCADFSCCAGLTEITMEKYGFNLARCCLLLSLCSFFHSGTHFQLHNYNKLFSLLPEKMYSLINNYL